MSLPPRHDDLLARLTRRQVLTRTSTTALAALVAGALPKLVDPTAARGAGSRSNPSLEDGTLQAFADTMVPGRTIARTQSGQPIYQGAIAGVDPLPGAVEADALELYHHPEVGFDALESAFIAELEARSLLHGGQFLSLPFAARVEVCLAGLDFSNPTYLVWEAASAVPFTAFCASALIVDATWHDAVGYRVMGLPGTAPGGYRNYSWRRKLSPERTRHGSLP